MRAKDYIEALYQSLRDGMSIDVVVPRLDEVLTRRGLLKLRSRILKGLLEKLKRAESSGKPRVIVAREHDLKRHEHDISEALEQIEGGTEYETRIDPTIIGGFITTGKGRRVDRSYKSTLLHAYHNVAD